MDGVKTVRLSITAAAIALIVAAHPARACELPDLRQAGESRASADDRLRRDFQARLLADSEVVFVGDLSSMTRDHGVSVAVAPIAFLKGKLRVDSVNYLLEQTMLACGLLSWPTMEFPGVYFGNRDPSGEFRVTGMLTYDAIRDQALLHQFNERLDLGPPTLAVRHGPDELQFRRLPNWTWFSGAIALSLLAGAWIGRASRKTSPKQTPRS